MISANNQSYPGKKMLRFGGMQLVRQTILTILLSAALVFYGPQRSFPGSNRMDSRFYSVSGSSLPYVPEQTGMSRRNTDAAEVLLSSANDHLQEGSRAGDSSRVVLFLPKRFTVSVGSCAGSYTADTAPFSRLFLSCGVIRRKLIPRPSPFFIS